MNELRDVLKRHDDALAASLIVAPEFDAHQASKRVRFRRTTRTALTAAASVAAAGAIGMGGWWVYENQSEPPAPVVTTPSPSFGTPSPTPSATVAGRDAAPGPCPSRANAMTLEEATIVSGEPLTGETWLAEPVAVGAPAAAGTTWDEYAEWFRVGERGGETIYAVYSFMQGVQLIEVTPDGSLTWIANPFPADPEGPSDWTLGGVNKDADQCYESLALPTTVELVDGVVGELASLAGSTKAISDGESEGRVRAVGGSSLYRVVGAGESPAGVAGMPAMTLVSYRIKTPFGGWLYPGFEPLRGATPAPRSATWIDYFDQSCGDTPGFQALVPAGPESEWTVVGQVAGRDVAIPTAANPYAIERYAAYVDHFEVIEDTTTVPDTFEAYLESPGLVALRADEGGRWVQINAEYTPRAWC